MDYRYETKDEARDYHKKRRAFLIINDTVELIPLGCDKSHFEYCTEKGISKEEFNKLTRGYYMDGRMVFYKDDFIYDDNLMKEAFKHIDEIMILLDITLCDLYFGVVVSDNFRPDYYFGKYEYGSLLKR